MLHSHYFSIVRNNEINCCDDLLLLFLKYFVLFPLRASRRNVLFPAWWGIGAAGGNAGYCSTTYKKIHGGGEL